MIKRHFAVPAASLCLTGLLFSASGAAASDGIRTGILLKKPGNPACEYVLSGSEGVLKPESGKLPVTVTRKVERNGEIMTVELVVSAEETVYYNLGQSLPTGFSHDDCLFYMPGFWYRKNLRSPETAPSFRTSDSWSVCEDRLSTPLTGVFDEKTGEWCTVRRVDGFETESLAQLSAGEVILGGKTSIGFTGFRNEEQKSEIVFGFPYREAPKTYLRKLKLMPPVTAFVKLEAGESDRLVWEVRKGRSDSWSDFIATVWETSYSCLTPAPVKTEYTPQTAKTALTRYFDQAFVDEYPLKYFASPGMRVDDCENTPKAEVGFIGRVLLNAFNAIEYGHEASRPDLVEKGEAVLGSYLENGFSESGLFMEYVKYTSIKERPFSIRRQSEGVYAIFNYLRYEKKAGRSHPEWERKIRTVLDRLSLAQNEDGSFPRKFNDSLGVIDSSGGSTSSAVLPFAMAYRYFGDRKYLETARKAASYVEHSLIATADYFSSTLDANCEDKEASLYASTAMYYMYLVEKKKSDREHYAQLCLKSAYFALSWYYLWDVPFAQGQMLGDLGFKSRGWGNVSVENNHIDVFIFEFADVLDFLAEKYGKPQFSAFTEVIRTSMLQLMPVKGNLCGITREGYYPEVVQHTNWDYGKNGKGYYNEYFAPGWTVASLWQMLSPGRVTDFFGK